MIKYGTYYIALFSGVGNGGQGDMSPPPPPPPPGNSHAEKVRGFWLTHYCNGYISIYVFSFWGKPPDRHQSSAPGPRWGTSVPSPRFVPLRNKFLATPMALSNELGNLNELIGFH